MVLKVEKKRVKSSKIALARNSTERSFAVFVLILTFMVTVMAPVDPLRPTCVTFTLKDCQQIWI